MQLVHLVLWWVLPLDDFVASCLDHLENTGSWSYAWHPDMLLLYNREERRHLLAPLILSKKSWSVAKLSDSSWHIKVSPSSGFFFKDIILLLEKSAVRWFPWSDWLTFYALEKISAKSRVLITVFCHFFLGVPWKRGASSASDSVTRDSYPRWYIGKHCLCTSVLSDKHVLRAEIW